MSAPTSQHDDVPGVRAHLERYGGGDLRHRTLVVGNSTEQEDSSQLAEAARELTSGDVLVVLGEGSAGRARRRVRRLGSLLRDQGFEPLGWHPSVEGPSFCLYARRRDSEPALPAFDRGGPRHPPRIPVAPVDLESAVTDDLSVLADSRHLCDWMFSQYSDHVRGAVLEVGAGIGTFSERILSAGAERLLLLEPARSCALELAQRFGADERVRIVDERLPDAPSLEPGAYDLIVCQNVLEHIGDDLGSVRAMGSALAPGGLLVVLVPAHPRLFGSLDESYGHQRRYTRARMRALFEAADLELGTLRPFNALGIPGWWWKNRWPGARLDRRSLRAYEALVRVWRPLESALRPPWGLSLVAHGRRRRGRSAVGSGDATG